MLMTRNKNDLAYLFMGITATMVYVWPYYFSVLIPEINGLLFLIFRYTSYFITLLLAYIFRQDLFILIMKCRLYIMVSIALFGTLVLSTSINSGNVSETFVSFFRCTLFSMFLACCVVSKNIYLLKGVALSYNALIVITFLCLFINLPGISGVYNFATTKNVFFRFVFLGILVDAYLDWKQKGEISKHTIFILGLVCITNYLCHSSTGFSVSFIVLILLIIKKHIFKSDFRIAKASLFFFVALFLSVLVIFFRQFAFYSDAVTSLFGKDVTFTGRSDLWDQALTQIYKNPILGIGHVNGDLFGNELWSSSSCHNFYLDVIIETGFVGLSCVAIFFIALIKNIDYCMEKEMSQMFAILIFGYFISYDFEVFFNSGQYIYNFPTLFFIVFCFSELRRKSIISKIKIIYR